MKSYQRAGDVAESELRAIRGIVEEELPAYLEDLATLVNVDCGSYTKAGVDRVGQWTARFLERLGATVAIHSNERLGDTIVGTFRGNPRGPRALLIGHLDTVFDPGTAKERPFRVSDGRAYGPGVTDMKSGLLAGLYAILALRAAADDDDDWMPFERLVFVANPDEEIGSPASTAIIREAALGSDVAFVLECARANGDIVSSRKGTVDLRLTIRGRAAHAGVEPEKGRSAILEAAHLTIALQALNGRWPGVTCNVGVLKGGTRKRRVRAGGPRGGRAQPGPRRSRDGRGGGPGHLRGLDGAGRDDHDRGGGAPLADGEAGGIGTPGRPRAGAGPTARLRRPRRSDRWRLGREHHLRTGRAHARRPRPGRRRRPRPGRVPRARLDRASRHAPGRPAAGDGARRGRGHLAAAPGMNA